MSARFFLLPKGFRLSTLKLLNRENLAKLAADYGYKTEVK